MAVPLAGPLVAFVVALLIGGLGIGAFGVPGV